MSAFRKYMALFSLSLSGGAIYYLPYLKDVMFDPTVSALGITNEQFGFLLTLYAIGGILLYVPGGYFADKFPAKKTIIIALLATSALTVWLAFSLSYTVAKIVWLLLPFTTAFVFWSSLMKAVRMIGDSHEQGRLYGLYYAGNGAAALIGGALSLWGYTLCSDSRTGLQMALIISALVNVVAAVSVYVFLKENTENVAATSDADKFHFADVLQLLKKPQIWLIAFTIFCTYGLYTSGSYFNPYLSNVIGIDVTSVGALALLRTSGLMLICAPLGGYIADKMGSTSKWFMIAFSLLFAIYMVVIFLPQGTNSTIVIAISMLPGAIAIMMYGIMYSVIEECKIPHKLTGTVIGIASIIGYLPDFFFNTLFGRWMDQYGNDGYLRIFIFLAILCIAGIVFSYFIRRLSKRLPK